LGNKFYIFLVVFVFSLSCSKSKNDSKFSKSTDADSVAVYLNAANNEMLPSERRYESGKKALKILEDNRNDTYYRNQTSNVARTFLKLQQETEFKKTVGVLLEKSIQARDSLNIAKSYNMLANQHMSLNQNDSAYYFLLKSERLFMKINDSINLGQNYIDKAFVQLYENDYSGCELSSIQALSYLKDFNIFQREYDAYNLIGISSNELKNYENALIYHNKALAIVKKHPLNPKFHFEANSRNNIGVVYQNLNQHSEAVLNFREGLQEANLLEDYPSLYAILIDNLAYSKFKLKDFNQLPDLFFQSLKIRVENEMPSGVIANKIHLSEFFAEKKDTLNSQKYANEALQLAKNTKISGDLLGSLKQLSLVEHKNASRYSNEYIKISDSLQQEERKAKDKFARIQFETDEIIIQKDKLAEQNRSLLYFFIGTLFIGILLFVIRAQRAKNRELLLRQAQQKANEDIYNLMISQQETIEASRVKEKKRIAQELHDGVLGRLFGARLNLDSLNRFNDEDSVASRFNYLTELKNIEQDIREISHDLNREKYVLINNFLAIVNNLIEEQRNSFDPDIELNIDDKIKWEKVSNAVKINLYRILQESLQNINKYANANRVTVDFIKNGEKIILKITDDGAGFEVTTRKKGIGLQNMLSRANECNGEFDIKSKKNKGTTIIITVPVEIKTLTTL